MPNLIAATEALSKLGGTYLTRHAHDIAKAALAEPTDQLAEQAVYAIAGHTSVGARNAARWAQVARQAAGSVG